MFSLGPGGSPQNPEMSVDQAKHRLREWGVEADASLHMQIEDLLASVKKTTRSVLPWAAGGALLMGWLTGRRKKSERTEESRSPGMIRTVLGLVRDFGPLVATFMAPRDEEA